MSIKHILKSFTTIRKSCALTAAIATLLTLTAIAANVTVSEGMDLVVDPGDTATFDTPMNISTYKVYGTMNVSARDVSATKEAKNYIGGDGKDGVLNVTGVFHDTSNHNGAQLEAARNGGTATINVSEDAMLDLDWKYLYASCYSEETRPATVGECSKTTLNIDGTVWLGEIHAADWYFNGDLPSRSDWPVALEVNIGPRGFLATRCIGGNDKALINVNLRGGKLECRWDRDGIMAGGGAYLTVDFAQDTVSAIDTENHRVVFGNSNRVGFTGNGGLRKTGSGELVLDSSVDDSAFTGDIYVENGTLNYPIVADGIARKVYFQGGALAVPENGTFVTVANGGSVEFVSVDGADIKLISNGNAKLCPAGSTVRCSGTGKPVFEGSFAPGGEIQCGSNSNGAFSSSLPVGVAYGKVGSGTDTLIVNGPSNINIHEGKLRTGKFRFWRMVFDDNAGTGNGVQLCELWLYEDPDGDGNATRIEPENRDWTVSSHSTWEHEHPNEGVAQLFDGNGSKFLSFDGFNGNADIIIEFPEPREIRAYQWWTADDCLDPNNGDCRTPTAWHWLASTDGENWLEVARESGFDPATSNEDPAECATNAYKLAGTWWLDYGKTHLPNPLASSTITIDPGAALLIDKAEAVKVVSVINNGGAVELTQAGSVLNIGTDSTTYLLGGGVTGLGGIEKTGSGTTHANGANTYSGDTVISEGTYAIVPSQTAAPKFFRFSFSNTEYGNSQFAWLKLCSVDGTIQSTGLTEVNFGTAAANLDQGTYSRTTDFSQWSDGNFVNVFDESTDTKFGGAANGQIVLRLRDDTAPIAYYDVMSGGDDEAWGRRLTGFTLESSIDGETWQTVSEVKVTDRTRKNKAWYSGTSCGYLVRHFTGTTGDTTIPATSTVEVKPGATLVVNTEMTISKLRINLDDENLDDENATPGKIIGFTPARNGLLELVCTDSEILSKIAAHEEFSIAIDLDSISRTAKADLYSWKCTLNGSRCIYRLVPGKGAGNSRLKPKGSFTMYIH